MEKHGDAQAIRFTTKDDHGSLTIVNVSTFLRENQSDPQSQTRFLVFDSFNISTSQGDKTTLTYNPGSKFGFFYLTHYQHFPHTPDGSLTEVREHTSQCLCVGEITELNKIITPDIEYSNELNAAELQKLGIEMLNFFMNLGNDYLWIKQYLTEPWDYLSDIEILSGVLNRDKSTCISAEQIQHIYQSNNPLSFQEVFQFDPNDQKKNSLRYFTYLPSRQGPPIRFVRSEVIVKKDITADGKLKVIVELDRGIPVKKDTKFVDERYEKITLEHYPDQQSGLYKKSVPAATTGRKGENPLVSFSDSSFIMGEIMAANYDDVQT